MKKALYFVLRVLIIIFAALVVAYFIQGIFVKPSLDRDWTDDQKILATSEISGDIVKIKNIRNINYRSTTDYDVHYYDKTFDLNKLDSVWFIVEPFSGHGAGAAHTFVSFGFEDKDYVSISVEIRKEKGEAFSALKGILRQYELAYVVADERDVVKLRSNYRKDQVYMYKANTSKENMRKLFVSMLDRGNKLATEPEFYNALTSSCTTNIVTHINEIVPNRVPFSYKVLMPAYSDELAQEIGLIDNSIPIQELREKNHINAKAEKYADDPLFSQKIRE